MLLYGALVSVVSFIGVRRMHGVVHRCTYGASAWYGESAFVWCISICSVPRLLVQVLTKTMTSRTTHQPMKWAHKLSYLPEFGALHLPHHSH